MNKDIRETFRRFFQPALNIITITRDKYAPELREIRIYVDFRGDGPKANVQLLGKDSGSFKAHGDYFDDDKWENELGEIIDFETDLICTDPAWEWARR